VTCREFADFIADYLTGGLPPAVAASFERHLSLCPNCEIYLAQYRATVDAGREAFDDEETLPAQVPEELIQAILAIRRS
jgi:anti-sigma factor RsiW